MLLFSQPSPSKTGKSLLTTNKMGFDVLNHKKSQTNWLIDAFHHFIKENQRVILDVGCGYGTISLDALSQGHHVIANDVAAEHLIEVRRRAIQRDLPLHNLDLYLGSFPDSLDLPHNSLDAVMIHRVLHFLPPQQIERGLSNIYQWLKPGGALFILVMAPQNKSFSHWFLPIYEKRWQAGDPWPGYDLLVEKALPNQAYNLPKTLHVMDGRPLMKALQKHRFHVEKTDFIDMRHFGNKTVHRDGREAIGLIAFKKHLS